jgi:MFS transporter, DHA1 family, tetracycline resistance protein
MALNTPELADHSPSRSALAVLFSVVFLDNIGFAIVLPYLYFYQLSLGGSGFTYGLLLASYSLLSFVCTPIVSRLSDHYGRRRILLLALAISSFAYFAFGTAQVLWLLFASRMLSGTTAATVPVAQAYVADVTSDKNRLRYLGLVSSAAGVAFILGPALGGVLSSTFGYVMPSFLASALVLANLASAYFKLPEPPRAPETRKSSLKLPGLGSVLKQKTMVLLFAAYFMFFVAFVFMQSVLSPWLKDTFGGTSLAAGLYFFYIGGVSVFSQVILLPRLSKRFSRQKLALVCTVGFAVGLAMLSFLRSIELLLVAGAVISFGFGGLIVVLNTLISLNAPKESQGGTLGSAWALAALAQTIAPILAVGAYVVGSENGFPGFAFAVSTALSVAMVPLVLSLKKRDSG